MTRVIRVAPEYSMVFFADRDFRGPVPRGLDLKRIAINDVCLVVGVLMWQDGETSIVLTDSVEELSVHRPPDVEAVISTPSGRVVLSSVAMEVMWEVPTRTRKTGLRVWKNHPTEPDEVIVLVADGGDRTE